MSEKRSVNLPTDEGTPDVLTSDGPVAEIVTACLERDTEGKLVVTYEMAPWVALASIDERVFLLHSAADAMRAAANLEGEAMGPAPDNVRPIGEAS